MLHVKQRNESSEIGLQGPFMCGELCCSSGMTLDYGS